MAEEGLFTRVAEDDPRRCIAITGNGQCRMMSHTGTTYCMMHGRGAIASIEKKKTMSYELTRHRAAMERHKGSDEIKSLRAEIAITRMVLETIINKCEDQDDILMHSSKINELVKSVEKLVVSCSKLEITNNEMLGRDKIIIISQVMIAVISKYITDPVLLETISNELMTGISNAINNETAIIQEERPVVPHAEPFEIGFDEEECDDGE